MIDHEFLAKNHNIGPQPPVLTPADFFLFPKLKTSMKESVFATIERIEKISSSSCVSRIRKNSGIRLVYLKEITLKMTT